MVQSVNAVNNFGTLSKLGQTEDGRIVYKITDSPDAPPKTFSVAQKDVAIFEKSYNDIMESAPKLQKYAQKSPKELERRKMLSKWIIGVPITLGAGIPLIKAKGGGLKQALLTIGGAILGATAGILINTFTMTPDGAAKMAKATQNLTKIDIKQV